MELKKLCKDNNIPPEKLGDIGGVNNFEFRYILLRIQRFTQIFLS